MLKYRLLSFTECPNHIKPQTLVAMQEHLEMNKGQNQNKQTNKNSRKIQRIIFYSFKDMVWSLYLVSESLLYKGKQPNPVLEKLVSE